MSSRMLASLAAVSLIVAPLTAEANTRNPSPVETKEQIAGAGTAGLLIGLALVAALVALVGKGTNDTPASP